MPAAMPAGAMVRASGRSWTPLVIGELPRMAWKKTGREKMTMLRGVSGRN